MLSKELIDKYKIIYIDKVRYYKIDLKDELIILDNCTPYYFKCGDIELYETSWVQLTLKLLNILDSLNPKSNEELLNSQYTWSKMKPFLDHKSGNYKAFKGIYFNFNHTATHALMNIKFLLSLYEKEIDDAYLIIKKAFFNEPTEVVDYIKNEFNNDFTFYLKLNNYGDSVIENYKSNINFINKKVVSEISKTYYDLTLYDDDSNYYVFMSRVKDKVKSKYLEHNKNYKIIINTLDLLTSFYNNRDTINYLKTHELPYDFKEYLKRSINYLFNTTNKDSITSKELYEFLNNNYSNMNDLGYYDDSKGVYSLASTLLINYFNFKNRSISKK